MTLQRLVVGNRDEDHVYDLIRVQNLSGNKKTLQQTEHEGNLLCLYKDDKWLIAPICVLQIKQIQETKSTCQQSKKE